MTNLKLAFRTLFRTPFVTAVAILSLALGIGANAAIFSIFNQMLLDNLPVKAPEQLVNLSSPGPNGTGSSAGDRINPAGVCSIIEASTACWRSGDSPVLPSSVT